MQKVSVRLCLLLAAAFVSLAVATAYALTFPALTGRVVDEAGILDATTEQSLADKLAGVEAANGAQIVVVTLKSLQGTSLEDYGYQLGRAWGIGQKDKNNGVLLIVVPQDRKVRIEVGYGLEGELTDAVTRLIIQNSILPRFRTGDFAGGIARGIDDVVQVVSGDAADFKQRAARHKDPQPAGTNLVNLIVLAIVLIVVFRMLTGGGGGRGLRRRGGMMGPIFIPSGGSWSSGSSGGGFSGGGGSFGGGGASGDW